jgi:hypothetical protein
MAGDTQKKNRRRGCLSALTRETNLAKRHIAMGRKDKIEGCLEVIEEKFDNFEKAHREYCADLTEDAELEEADLYFEAAEKEFVESLLFIRNWLDSNSTIDKKPATSMKPDGPDTAELLNVMNLPKLELQHYDGDPLAYHNFLAAFDEHVDRATSNPHAKLNRLIQCTTGKAKEAISACQLIGGEAGYADAQEILRRRFGNDHLISTRIIGNLKTGKPIKSSEDLQKLADDMQNCLSTLNKLNRLFEIDTQSSIIEIAHRFQPYMKNRWKRYVMDQLRENDKYPDFKSFVEFVIRESEEASDPVYGSFNARPSHNSSRPSHDVKQKPSSFVSSFAANAKPQHRTFPPCVVCSDSHRLFSCEKFKAMKPIERLGIVESKKLCKNCLLANHSTEECRKPSVCTVPQCGQKHTRFIHVDNMFVKPTSHKDVTSHRAEAISSCGKSSGEVFLPIVKVTVNDTMKTHALLDSGATTSFCTQRLVDTLGIHGNTVQYTLSTLNESRSRRTKLVNLNLVSHDGNDCLLMSNVYVVDNIAVNVPATPLHVYKHLSDLPLHSSSPQVDVLIGQDNAVALHPLEARSGQPWEPFAVRTLLGWSVNGPVASSPVSKSAIANFVTTSSLDSDVKALWEIERDDVHVQTATWSNDDKKVMQLWDEKVRVTEGHYELPIPWKADTASIPNNVSQALARLRATQSSLDKRNLTDRYDAEIRKLLDKGYAEPVPYDQLQTANRIWYLPHHAVLNPNKPNKLRVVFDCAARFQGTSLNERCYQGPDLNNQLTHVLLRFRQHQFAVMGDIESMFHQIRIPVYDRDSLRFLWHDSSGKIRHFRMTSHLFGGVWCSSSATYALRRLLFDHTDIDDIVADVVQNCFYVDDCLISMPTRDEAIHAVTDTVSLLQRGGFRLTKFVTNDAAILTHISPEERGNDVLT